MSKLKLYVRFLKSRILFEQEDSQLAVYDEIKDGVNFRGFNIWILCFAMIMACVGLNTNSLSAVIGAMLISPLMGPITGLAFAIAINDKKLKKISTQNWLIMTGISLIAATFYFLMSPFDDATEQLEAFKKASIFDILLAFFGGMAGFVGILKKDGGKVLAGVAVATACMPPLCTAAYGIAHANYTFFIGGLYFYLINCLFIGIATFLLSRYFGFHTNKSIAALPSTIKWLWYFFIVIMMAPGLYIAYKKWHFEKQEEKKPTDKQRIEILEKRVQQLDSMVYSTRPE